MRRSGGCGPKFRTSIGPKPCLPWPERSHREERGGGGGQGAPEHIKMWVAKRERVAQPHRRPSRVHPSVGLGLERVPNFPEGHIGPYWKVLRTDFRITAYGNGPHPWLWSFNYPLKGKGIVKWYSKCFACIRLQVQSLSSLPRRFSGGKWCVKP